MTDFTYFTKIERRGLIVFFTSLVILFGGLHLWNAQRITAISSEELITEALQADNINLDSIYSLKTEDRATPLPVNPNEATHPQLIAIGFSNYAATSLINYRKTGARFYDANDLSKVYGMDSTLLVKVLPWLQFENVVTDLNPEKSGSPRVIKEKKRTIPTKSVDPNTATIKELTEFGLSKYAANNLVNYRKAGARFTSHSDLFNIYGIDSTYLKTYKDLLVFSDLQGTSIDSPVVIQESLSTDKLNIVSVNPNSASQEELVQIGLSPRSAKTLINFRKTGAEFFNKKDMLQVYGITDSVYQNIEPYLLYDVTRQEDNGKENVELLNVNDVSREELLAISGIGEYLSKAIIDYRVKLGGYREIEQLAEVPSLRPETYDKIKEHFIVKGEITKFHPLALEFKELLKHPYIDYETAKLLKNMSVNDYQIRIKELIKEKKIDSRLIPYLIQ